MNINRKNIISNYPWLKEKNLHFIISADYDGIICASFLNHHLNWKLAGYYNLDTIWLSNEAINNKSNIIWVDLNILPHKGRTIGGHIVSINKKFPKGFQSSCNPNLILNLDSNDFLKKFPFSTLLFLMWIHNIYIPKNLFAKQLVLNADAVWLKYQHYKDNVNNWSNILLDYNWKEFLNRIDTKKFEQKMDETFYPKMNEIGAITKNGKLKGKHYNLSSKQYQCNPDWDEDVLLKLFDLIGNTLNWTPPILPNISKIIIGTRKKISLSEIKKIGLNQFINKNKIFSYAIPTSRTFNYTTFLNQKYL